MPENRWRHKKGGTLYVVLFDAARLLCSSAPALEEQFTEKTFTIYQSVKTGAIYIRPTEEFLDGRYEKANNDK